MKSAQNIRTLTRRTALPALYIPDFSNICNQHTNVQSFDSLPYENLPRPNRLVFTFERSSDPWTRQVLNWTGSHSIFWVHGATKLTFKSSRKTVSAKRCLDGQDSSEACSFADRHWRKMRYGQSTNNTARDANESGERTATKCQSCTFPQLSSSVLSF